MRNINWKGVARWHSFRGHDETAEAIRMSMQPKIPRGKTLGEVVFEQETEEEVEQKINEMKKQETNKNDRDH